MIFGEFATLKENNSVLDNTILLVLFKDVQTISNSFQESNKTTDTLAAFSTDHSPITLSLCYLQEFPQGKGLWKFNKSSLKNKNYREQMKTLIKNVLDNSDQDNIGDPQYRWEHRKYEIRKFSIHYSKDIARNKGTERTYLENKLKTLETSSNFVDHPEYTETNEKLIKIYQEKTNGIRIRNKCNWYKSRKIFKIFSKFRKILCSSKSNLKHLNM